MKNEKLQSEVLATVNEIGICKIFSFVARRMFWMAAVPEETKEFKTYLTTNNLKFYKEDDYYCFEKEN